MSKKANAAPYSWRRYPVMFALFAVMAVLGWRAVDLHVFEREFLQAQADARHIRTVPLSAHRGIISDRRGRPLAVSTPVDSIIANPKQLLAEVEDFLPLAKALGIKSKRLRKILEQNSEREFFYLRRHVNPADAQKVAELNMPGVDLQREYKRYYPDAEVAAHVLGFTDIDDVGQEGLERAYDDWLQGRSGKKRVLKDRYGRVVEDLGYISEPQAGNDLQLSIDRRLQYLAYRELKRAVKKHKARSGSVVMLDARTGEVLAMVNQPAFNPNDRSSMRGDWYRNRAVTDVFEPGSTLKPFTVAAALESGLFKVESKIDTTPGYWRVGANTIRDHRNYGVIDLPTLIQKSSNVGASKLALAISAEQLWSTLDAFGFGEVSGSGLQGESAGVLGEPWRWRDIERATIAYGYGVSVTPLQLARAYSALADDGMLKQVSFIKLDEAPIGKRVLSSKTVSDVRDMLSKVVLPGGTGTLAAVPGYQVAGKTGTIKKVVNGSYGSDAYLSVFAGMAPANDPRLVTVVLIEEPKGGEYYGGIVAAPVFSAVTEGALRLLGIVPDSVTTVAQVAD
ncbi:MAG: cell division protein [Gammaproteobacteria bacterium]|nr:penicillin-binding protein 2 [Gammaproteobacteria bacterium]PCH62467.1 MAG: cell division protein [Gammaproteobacteria bacterium]